MSRKSKIVIGLIILLTALSLSYGAYKYLIKHDYFMYLNAACEPAGKYNCFVYEEEGEISDPYVKVYRKAFEVERCYETGKCDPFVCREDEEDCLLITCDEESLEEGETCAEIDEITNEEA